MAGPVCIFTRPAPRHSGRALGPGRAFMIDTGPFDPRDYLRALRPGGPMDRFVLTCRCLACGEQATEPARWYHEHSMRCSCGGQFDTVPFEELTLFIDGRCQGLPRSVRVVPYIGEDGARDG